MCVMNTDALSYVRKTPQKCLHEAERGEGEDEPGGLPPATLTLLPHCSLGARAAGGGDNGYPEKDSQSPGHQVASALLKDVLIP